MITLQLQREVEARLAAEAQERGLPIERYVESLVATRPPVPSYDQKTINAAVDRILEHRKDYHLNGLKMKDLVQEGRKY